MPFRQYKSRLSECRLFRKIIEVHIFNSSYRQWKGSSRKIYNIKLADVKASVRWSKARNQKQRTLLVFGNEITEIKRLCSSDHVPSITKQWALINKKKTKIIDANKYIQERIRGIVSMTMIQNGSIISSL